MVAEYEVTARLSRTARFRVMAGSREDAEARVLDGADGVRSMQDLDGESEISEILGAEVVAAE